MFNFLKKPKAIIVVSRLTGQQEQCTITVNAFDTDKKSLYEIIKNAADALQQRLVETNMAALGDLTTKGDIPTDKPVKVTDLSKYKSTVKEVK